MRRLIWAVAAVVVLASAASAAAPADSTAGATLAPCGTVTRNTTLKRDCLGPLTVAASNIKVNLGGHSVVCTSPVDGIVLEDRSRVSIVKGHVHGCEIGIRIDGGNTNTVDGLHVDGNAWQGILIRGSSANVVRSTQVLGNGTTGRLGARGVMVQRSADGEIPSDGNVLDRVTAKQNTAYGIEINGSTGNRLISVIADANAVGGISIDGLATSTTVESSRGSSNGGFGVFVSGSDNTIKSSTFASNTGTRGFGVQLSLTAARTIVDGNVLDTNVVGIRIGGSDNIVRNNGLAGNSRDGIALGLMPDDAGPTGNVLTGNKASGSGRWDLADLVAGYCTLNTWHGNAGVRLFDGCEASP
jgi:parallel beta-helix repeat protein